MDSKSTIFLVIVLMLLVPLLSTSLYAQYTFDVKTQVAEKDQLQNYKQGLLTAISNSNWASLKETGEDYSLWIHNLERELLVNYEARSLD